MPGPRHDSRLTSTATRRGSIPSRCEQRRDGGRFRQRLRLLIDRNLRHDMTIPASPGGHSPARWWFIHYGLGYHHYVQFGHRACLSRSGRVPMTASHYVPHTKIPTLVFPTSAQAARHVALLIESLIRQNNSAGRPTVLGLPTGSTPVGLYRELIRLHNEAGLDFSRVVTFNLDEYFPMPPDDPHSYHRWMQETFFNHVNIPTQNIHIPDGTMPAEEVEDYCAAYEQKIRRAGGIDLQILGIGRTGHIGFNEPGSTRHSRTRLVTLDPVTRRDAASGFFGEENVPHQAITMGVGTILEARKIVIMAFGEHKAGTVQRAVEGEVTDAVAASFLQKHPDATFLLDEAAAGQLTAIRRPWMVGPVQWTPDRIRQAVIWLSLKGRQGAAQARRRRFPRTRAVRTAARARPGRKLGRRVFDDRMGDHLRGAARAGGRAKAQKTALVFSPHPDDDVISMGGTLIRLVEQGHDVHIAYMTSGNIAVFDHDACASPISLPSSTDFSASTRNNPMR